jgi:hypothetical protein
LPAGLVSGDLPSPKTHSPSIPKTASAYAVQRLHQTRLKRETFETDQVWICLGRLSSHLRSRLPSAWRHSPDASCQPPLVRPEPWQLATIVVVFQSLREPFGMPILTCMLSIRRTS